MQRRYAAAGGVSCDQRRRDMVAFSMKSGAFAELLCLGSAGILAALF